MPFCQLNLCARLSFLNCAAAAAGPGFGSWVLTRGWPWPQWYQKSISTPTACSFLIKFYKKPKCETSVKTNWVWLNLVKMRSRRSTPLSTGQFNPIQAKLNRDSPQNESINDTQLATMTAAKKSPLALALAPLCTHFYLPDDITADGSGDDNYSEYK